MKSTFLFTMVMIATTLAASFGSAQQKMKETDLSQVYGAGQTVSALAPQIKLNPGVYAIGDDENKWKGTHYLVVDEYVNNDQQGLALLISQEDIKEKSQAVGRFYMIRPIRRGTLLMLSPIEIVNGQLTINSELDVTGNSPVLTVSLDPQHKKMNYPYIIKGNNGALGGQILGMRAKSDQNPTFRPWPAHSVFNAETGNGKILIEDKILSISSKNETDREFELVPINGALGKMAALVDTKLNTMEEDYISNASIKQLAFFMNLDGCELFMIARPTVEPGQFMFNFYGERGRTFMDFIRHGKLEP
jgi:hypothetical protein